MNAQTILGTKGMLNVPTADMAEPGTFVGGINFVPKEMGFTSRNYDTGLYFVNFTPFSWMEITLRETLLKTTKKVDGELHTGFYQQDRSSTLRLRPLTEQISVWWRPSVVVGVNDIYSDHGGSRYTAAYLVATKHFALPHAGTFGASLGYARKFDTGVVYNGLFGGIEYIPQGMDNVRLIAEYDTSGFNAGVHLHLFRHLNIMAFTRELKCVSVGVCYQYTINY